MDKKRCAFFFCIDQLTDSLWHNYQNANYFTVNTQ